MICLAGPSFAEPCKPYIEEQAGGTLAAFRPHATALQHCEVGRQAYRRVISQWLAARAPDAPPLTAIALGRAANHPWISQELSALALRDGKWLAQAKRAPRGGERDRLVATLLQNPGLLKHLGEPLEGTPYELRGVTYEKVLWRTVDGTEVPFDAQLWLRLEPRR